MAERIVELETCTVVFPDGFDANQWSYDVWLSQRKRNVSRTVPVVRKETPQETEEIATKLTNLGIDKSKNVVYN